MEYLPEYIASILTEDPDILVEAEKEYFASVAVVKYRNKWLLGLGHKCGDDRTGHWCCVGGGIKPGESVEQAAVRECYEEAGVRCKAIKKLPDERDRPGVAFVLCQADNFDPAKLKPNHEFSAMGWFSSQDFRGLKLYHNVRRLIQKARRA